MASLLLGRRPPRAPGPRPRALVRALRHRAGHRPGRAPPHDGGRRAPPRRRRLRARRRPRPPPGGAAVEPAPAARARGTATWRMAVVATGGARPAAVRADAAGRAPPGAGLAEWREGVWLRPAQRRGRGGRRGARGSTCGPTTTHARARGHALRPGRVGADGASGGRRARRPRPRALARRSRARDRGRVRRRRGRAAPRACRPAAPGRAAPGTAGPATTCAPRTSRTSASSPPSRAAWFRAQSAS